MKVDSVDVGIREVRIRATSCELNRLLQSADRKSRFGYRFAVVPFENRMLLHLVLFK